METKQQNIEDIIGPFRDPWRMVNFWLEKVLHLLKIQFKPHLCIYSHGKEVNIKYESQGIIDLIMMKHRKH